MGCGHYAVVVVYVVVVAVVGLDSYHGHALGYADVYVSAFCLVAVGCLHEGARLEHFFNSARVYLAYFLAHGVDAAFLQSVFYYLRIDESACGVVGDVDVHLIAQRMVSNEQNANARYTAISTSLRMKKILLGDSFTSCFLLFLLFVACSCRGRLRRV